MSLRAILVSGAPATRSISEFVAKMYAEGGIAAFLMPWSDFKIALLRYFPNLEPKLLASVLELGVLAQEFAFVLEHVGQIVLHLRRGPLPHVSPV